MKVLGLDGRPGGWVGALVTEGPRGPAVQWCDFPGFGAGMLAALAADVDMVAADVPIGLPASGTVRASDAQARAVLGRRASSVFTTPWRSLAAEPTHQEASAHSRRLSGVGISIQAFGLYARICAVDAVMTRSRQRRVIEAHPEIAFLTMAGDVGSKHTESGLAARQLALAAHLPVDLDGRPRRARRDDALDALACAWTARRWLAGQALLLPNDPPVDERGLLMGVCG